MLFPSLTSALILAGLSVAQTPPGHKPEVTARLELIVGSKVLAVPGTSLTKAETSKQPLIGTSDVPLKGTYVWLMIDQDVPSNFQNPSAGTRRLNLHALITGFTSAAEKDPVHGVYLLTSPVTTPIPYTGPNPPAEVPVYPHRYVSLLYETPAGFNTTRAQVGSTLGFDLAKFVNATGLTVPVRANWWNVAGEPRV
ncbi:phosphatidylethanolamine-binding protein [Schizothecium vesticola]|uniref:Phosphatidylethanolamine-binding protein n=1 Tax=Schizothecium vesticola TaxID=314040 RepID=A0AA40FB10_9PEZI|nr:phosphatidylethanolamine-binding protein [Schizothecium vesticola]